MDYLQSFAISAAGMTVERTRVDIAALNLANANTIATAEGVSYRPLRVVARAISAPDFASNVETALGSETPAPLMTLPQADVAPADVSPRMSYEPSNPFADKRGFVAYPGVDSANEMVTLMTAMRAYEANVAAMNAARTLATRALDIGGSA